VFSYNCVVLQLSIIRLIMSSDQSAETCSCCQQRVTSVCQTLEEIDFERGIWSAALNGDTERVKKLLSRIENPDVPDSSSFTALVSEVDFWQSLRQYTLIIFPLLIFKQHLKLVNRLGDYLILSACHAYYVRSVDSTCGMLSVPFHQSQQCP